MLLEIVVLVACNIEALRSLRKLIFLNTIHFVKVKTEFAWHIRGGVPWMMLNYRESKCQSI